jgi:autotransporter-associated beta strand protein
LSTTSDNTGFIFDEIGVPVTLNDTLEVDTAGNRRIHFTDTGTGISGSGGITKTGTGWIRLDHTANSYEGKTAINGGVLSIAGGVTTDTGLGAVPDSYVADHLSLDGGTVRVEWGDITGGNNIEIAANRGITLGDGGGTFEGSSRQAFNFNSKITGTGDLTVNGSSWPFRLSATAGNDFTGDIIVKNSAILQAGGEAIPDTASVDVQSGGELRSWSLTETINGLTAASGTLIRLGSGTFGSSGHLIVGANDGGGTVAGNIVNNGTGTGTGKLTKMGSGTLVITGTGNTYAGATAITGGTLELSGDGDINSTSSITIGTDAKLINNSTAAVTASIDLAGGRLGGNGTYSTALTVDESSIIAPGNSIGTTTFTENVTFDGTGVLEIELGPSGTGDQIIIDGATFDMTAGKLDVVFLPDASGYSSSPIISLINGGTLTGGNSFYDSFFYNGDEITSDPFAYQSIDGLYHLKWDGGDLYLIPEPATLALLALSLTGLLMRRPRTV